MEAAVGAEEAGGKKVSPLPRPFVRTESDSALTKCDYTKSARLSKRAFLLSVNAITSAVLS